MTDRLLNDFVAAIQSRCVTIVSQWTPCGDITISMTARFTATEA